MKAITKNSLKLKNNQQFPYSAQDLFDFILMNSDEEVKTLMLERYSEIYPIPMLITDYETQEVKMFFQSAYFMKPYKTILSFGILKAGISKCGKSTLIDEIFSTDFTCNHIGNYESREGSTGYGNQQSKTNIYSIGRMDI